MVTIQEAIKHLEKKYPDKRIVSGLDMGSFYAFSIMPRSPNPQSIIDIPVQPTMKAIRKNNGSEFLFHIVHSSSGEFKGDIDVTPYLNSEDVAFVRHMNTLFGGTKHESMERELYHHGIKGQRWGVRRGPPYPLDSAIRSIQTSGSFARSEQDQVKNMRQKYSVIGDSGSAKSDITYDAKNIAKVYDFSIVSHPQTISEDIRNTNPGYYRHLDDDRWVNNCTHSCIAFAARRRGLDVEATPITAEQVKQGGETVLETCNRYFKGRFKQEDFQEVRLSSRDGKVSSALIGFDITKKSGDNYENIATAELGKLYRDVPDGGYGMVSMSTIYGGHVFVWYKEDGAIKFADSQGGINAHINFKNIARFGFGIPILEAVRFDNRELDPSRITEAIQSPSSELRHSVALSGGNFKMEVWRHELYHHGIKGQRWGVRKGPPYPLDAQDHTTAEKKAGWRKSLNKPAGSVRPNKRDDSDRVVLAKKGETVNHVKANRAFKAIKEGRALYVSKSQEDLETYLSTLSMDRDDETKNVYNTKLTVLEDLISPSETARVKEFVDLYSERKVPMAREIAKAKREFDWLARFHSEDALTKKYQKTDPEKLYKVFAETLTLNVNGQSEYFNRLKEKGYNAWVDDHDATFNNMHTKTATVVFDPIKSLKISEIETYNDERLSEIFDRWARKERSRVFS